MEKLFVLVFALMLVLGQPQRKIDADSAPGLEVRRFSWSRYRGSSINSERTERVNANNRQRELREEIENKNSIENQSREMRALEERAARDLISTKGADVYRYSIELRNVGTKVVKWIYLDYQISDISDPDNPSHRQFACAVKIKSNSTHLLEAFTSFPPRRVVSATSAATAPNESVIINRVEYSDDSFWQRPDWHGPEQLPRRDTGHGECRPL